MLGRTNTGGGGGGGGLNFQVVGGTTAPSNPKENMIWINTSTAITDWVFSATQPTAASGRVWITTGTSSTVAFSATKKNPIMVYPLSAKQYVGGALVDKTAKSYQGGKWVDWIQDLYLFQSGTGASVEFITANQPYGSVSVGTKSIKTSYTKTDSACVYAVTKNKVDITHYNTLYVEANTTATAAYEDWKIAIVVTNQSPNASAPPSGQAMRKMDADSTRKTYSVDISALSGEFHIGCWGVGKTDIYKIRLGV